jgi:hypothetical protein
MAPLEQRGVVRPHLVVADGLENENGLVAFKYLNFLTSDSTTV